MGENLEVDGRMSVRTPMQWNDGRNGGFSDASPSRLRRPVVEGRRPAGRQRGRATARPGLTLNWMERVIRATRDTPVLGWGRTHVLDTGDDGVLAHRTDWGEDSVLLVHNFVDELRRCASRWRPSKIRTSWSTCWTTAPALPRSTAASSS